MEIEKETLAENNNQMNSLFGYFDNINFRILPKDKLELKEEALQLYHPKQLVEQIDIVLDAIKQEVIKTRKIKKLTAFKWNENWRRIDFEFSKWSHFFNQIVRKQIDLFQDAKEENEKAIFEKYKYVYAYWWNTFHMVEDVLKHRTIFAGERNKKHIEKGRKTLFKLINDEVDRKEIAKPFLNLIEKLSKMKNKK